MCITGHKDLQYLIPATIQVYADSPQSSLISLLKSGCKPNTVQPNQHPISVHAAISGTLVTLFFSTMHQYSFPAAIFPILHCRSACGIQGILYIIHLYGFCLSEWMPSFLCCRLLASAAISGFGCDSILWGLLWNRLDIDL